MDISCFSFEFILFCLPCQWGKIKDIPISIFPSAGRIGYKKAFLTTGRRACITLSVLDKSMQNCSAQQTDEQTHLSAVDI